MVLVERKRWRIGHGAITQIAPSEAKYVENGLSHSIKHGMLSRTRRRCMHALSGERFEAGVHIRAQIDHDHARGRRINVSGTRDIARDVTCRCNTQDDGRLARLARARRRHGVQTFAEERAEKHVSKLMVQRCKPKKHKLDVSRLERREDRARKDAQQSLVQLVTSREHSL